MNFINFMIKIAIPNTVKFSYKYTRGSYADSVKYARNTIEETINELIDSCSSETITINKLKKTIKKVLPEKKRIDIKPVNEKDPDSCGYQDYVTEINKVTGKEKYCGYIISLPIKNGKFRLSNLPIFIHEFTHVLNALFTPKYTSQLIKSEALVERATLRSASNIPNFSIQYKDCYDNSLYTKEKFNSTDEIPDILNKRRKEILKMLKNRTGGERIVILQNFRYFLQSEICAYESEQVLYKMLKKYGISFNKDLFEIDISKCLLKEKIEMLKELCLEEIKKARATD